MKRKYESGDSDLCGFTSGISDSISLHVYGQSETIQDQTKTQTDLSQHLATRCCVLHCSPTFDVLEPVRTDMEANSLTLCTTGEKDLPSLPLEDPRSLHQSCAGTKLRRITFATTISAWIWMNPCEARLRRTWQQLGSKKRLACTYHWNQLTRRSYIRRTVRCTGGPHGLIADQVLKQTDHLSTAKAGRFGHDMNSVCQQAAFLLCREVHAAMASN